MNSTSGGQRIAVIDIARLAAALGVLIFHASGAAQVPKFRLPPFTVFGHTIDWLPSPFSFGATGVSLFFVVSGYCMYRSLSANPQPLLSYYRNRLARIYPLYFVAVLFSAVAMAVLGFAVTAPEVAVVLLFLHGFVKRYNLSLNGALWSMATEVQFYIVLPLLLRWARWIGLDRFAILAIMLSLVFRVIVQLAGGHEATSGGLALDTFLMNLLPGRAAEFAIGMWIAGTDSARARRYAKWLIVPAGIIGIGAKASGIAFAAEPMLGVFYGSLLIFALGGARWFGSTRGIIPLLGRASYALFLIHLPIAVLLYPLLPHDWGLYRQFAALLAMTLAVALPAALALHLFVELPLFDRLRTHRRGAEPRLAAAGGDGGAP
ncbi:MAG: acyltransferase [Sphingomonas sp.]|uniref:acyltransferase family protein n=1 Tax=Sphingomonas sp. TaxID=28214 RepID=UPI0011F7E99D|nr:acyltransferase [Sphingomonas sp.]THD35443.1 MAG: acyltransferase [Sphingomonas sp.]